MMTFIIIATLMVVTAVAVTVRVMQIRQMVLIKEAILREDARSNRDIQRRLEISFASRVEACGGEPNAIHELLMLAYEIAFIFRFAIPNTSEFLANCKLEQADMQSGREKLKTLSRRGFPVE